MCDVTVDEENIKLSVEANAPMPAKGSSRGSAGAKRWRDDALYGFKSPVIVVVNKPRTYVNHSYRDFSQLPVLPEERLQYSKKTQLEDMTFAEKMHHVLSKRELQACIEWKPHGRAFRILIPKDFEKHVCTEYFAIPPRYSSFLRQLNNHGFKQITQGPDRSCYYHEVRNRGMLNNTGETRLVFLFSHYCSFASQTKCFLRGMPWLCKNMPQPKNARLLIPDPENEPDFYTLSKLFPLPDQEQDDTVPPSALKKKSSSTQWGQPSVSSSILATNCTLAHAIPNAAGHMKASFQHPMVSIAALAAPFKATITAHPNVGVASNLDPDQLLLMMASGLKEEQDRRYGNALQRAALRGDFAINNGRFSTGFPF